METSLKDLLKQGKHQTQDFLNSSDDQKKIAKIISAFSNSEGGKLFIGVKENGKISGINPEEELLLINETCKIFCKPEIKFESKIWQEGHKLVLEVEISLNNKKNATALDDDANWKVFIRVNEHTLIANKILLQVWNFEKKGISKPTKFTEKELEFLNLFDSNEKKTLSNLYKISKLAKNKIDRQLALFVHWNMLKMTLKEEGTYYNLS
jgi:predicted HTH transcriptional regulator